MTSPYRLPPSFSLRIKSRSDPTEQSHCRARIQSGPHHLRLVPTYVHVLRCSSYSTSPVLALGHARHLVGLLHESRCSKSTAHMHLLGAPTLLHAPDFFVSYSFFRSWSFVEEEVLRTAFFPPRGALGWIIVDVEAATMGLCARCDAILLLTMAVDARESIPTSHAGPAATPSYFTPSFRFPIPLSATSTTVNGTGTFFVFFVLRDHSSAPSNLQKCFERYAASFRGWRERSRAFVRSANGGRNQAY
ncbi:hypothetical protein R3P38DRAFT_2818828 [Favolaschia claudopus]|uniref:Uncharacterized protein n=1 Tax=Favolaschia claudopus TaxID=2862362 RepID=A0AAW0ECZ0_9AGAR